MSHNDVRSPARLSASVRIAACTAIAALAIGTVGISVVGSAEPAQAACTAIGTKGGGTPSWTRAQSNDCAGNVQSRVYRYIQYSPTAYDGPQSRNSYVQAGAGVPSGHAMRIQVAPGGSAWTSWSSF